MGGDAISLGEMSSRRGEMPDKHFEEWLNDDRNDGKHDGHVALWQREK
jgi:hypothetical protein